MNKNINQWLEEYGESHQNPKNKTIHWFCVPLIMLSLIGLLSCIPKMHISIDNYILNINWSIIFLFIVCIYYLTLSKSLCLGMIIVSILLLYGVKILDSISIDLWKISIFIFILAWIGQFIGHEIEGKKPSFLKDIQFLLIGPAWLLSFIYKKFNISL